jgi:hypothetical protein
VIEFTVAPATARARHALLPCEIYLTWQAATEDTDEASLAWCAAAHGQKGDAYVVVQGRRRSRGCRDRAVAGLLTRRATGEGSGEPGASHARISARASGLTARRPPAAPNRWRRSAPIGSAGSQAELPRTPDSERAGSAYVRRTALSLPIGMASATRRPSPTASSTITVPRSRASGCPGVPRTRRSRRASSRLRRAAPARVLVDYRARPRTSRCALSRTSANFRARARCWPADTPAGVGVASCVRW